MQLLLASCPPPPQQPSTACRPGPPQNGVLSWQKLLPHLDHRHHVVAGTVGSLSP